MAKDASALMPNGSYFPFWEDETEYKTILYVDGGHAAADDSNPGTEEKPYKTINAAAQVAGPGTKVLIKGGVYRESVHPANGGTGKDGMVCYQAAEGEEVIIKASVVVDNFQPSVGWRKHGMREAPPKEEINIWMIELDPEDFKGYNPFGMVNIIHDRLFIEYGKTDMTSYLNRRGMIFIDGQPLKQVPLFNLMSKEPGTYWVEANGMKLHFRMPDNGSPAGHTIELTNREQCFAPKEPFLSYIHVKGLTCAHAAMGAPVPQRGAISCYRGHHWIIEGCTVDWANTVGIDCGNECWHHEPIEGQLLGYHIIRGNVIRDAGVCGIAGMRSFDLLIEDNLIDGTGWQRMELSWEAGGIKVHHAYGALFRRNVISHCIGCDAIWMDVDNYNCRLTGNLLIDGIDSREHIFMECNRDEENIIDNNIIWNVEGRYDRDAIPVEPGSSGWYKDAQLDVVNGYGIYNEGTDRLRIVNNLIGKCNNAGYYAKPVAFRIGEKRGGTARDNKFYNNLFYQCGEAAIKFPNPNNKAEGNVYADFPGGFLRVMSPLPTMCLDLPTWQEFCGYDRTGCMADMDIDIDSETLEMTVELRTTLPEVEADGKVTVDYFADELADSSRVAGPFAKLPVGKTVINVDPRRYGKT